MTMVKYLLTAAVLISLLVPGMGGDNMTTWFTGATASFYGDMHGRGTNKGACGYGDLKKQGYGMERAALSAALYNEGVACGGCYFIICVDDSVWCKPNTGVYVTATDFCAPNNTKPLDGTNDWYSSTSKHFRLALPRYKEIADEKTPVVPVMYRRVPCVKDGGVKFQTVKGDSSVMRVLLYKVAGAGDVSDVKIKGSVTSVTSGWLQMIRVQGQIWQIENKLQGQSLSFLVTTSDGEMIQFDDIVSENWRIGETYDGIKNFRR